MLRKITKTSEECWQMQNGSYSVEEEVGGRRGSFGCCRDKALSLKVGDGYACCYSLYAFLCVLNSS